MSDNIEYPKKPGNGKVFAGLILLAVGVIFLFQQLDFFFFPHWLFGWPVWLIVWGLFIGARHNFRNAGWLIMVGIGVAFLLNDAFAGYNIRHAFLPIAIIGFGIWMIVKRNHRGDDWASKWEHKWESKWNKYDRKGNVIEPVVDYTVPPVADATGNPSTPPPAGSAIPPHADDDYLDNVAVFGSINKTILSKNFRGGEIVNIFGGAELDFTQADIQGRVVIEITQVFGGIKLIVPSNWKVISDMSAVFAGIDDKRIKTPASAESGKILVLKGISIFAGIDIRSY